MTGESQLTFSVDGGVAGRRHLPGAIGIPHVGAIGRKVGQEEVGRHRSQLPVRAGRTTLMSLPPPKTTMEKMMSLPPESRSILELMSVCVCVSVAALGLPSHRTRQLLPLSRRRSSCDGGCSKSSPTSSTVSLVHRQQWFRLPTTSSY